MAKYSLHSKSIAMSSPASDSLTPSGLSCIEIDSDSPADASILWLHGLGADGNDFVPVAQALQLQKTRFILPHAAERAVSLNGGYVMRAWYDLFGLAADSPQDEAGIRASAQQIAALVRREQQRGISTRRIVLAGFSQGGAIALHTALRYPERLAGVLALSTYLPLKSLLAGEASAANRGLPIFMAHGTFDDVITLASCRLSAERLQPDYPLEWHEYAMAHQVCQQEITNIRAFLCRVLQK